MKQTTSRRGFLRTAAGAAGLTGTTSAKSYSQILGANDRILTGYWHSVGAIMATRAYREGKKLCWNREKDAVVESPPRKGLDSETSAF